MLPIKIILCAYSDAKGRKKLLALPFLLQGISNAFFPIARGFLEIAFVKTIFDIGASIKTSITSTVLYENAMASFAKITAWVSGTIHIMWAAASFLTAIILFVFDFDGAFLLIAMLEIIAFTSVVLIYKEKRKSPELSRCSFKQMYSLNVKRNMWVLMCAVSLFYVGIFLSHGFAQPLYFQAKYNLSTAQIGVITGLHRLSLAIPLFYTGTIMHKLRAKKAYVISAFTISVFLFGMGLANSLLLALPMWLLHDALGGSINVPIQEILIQKNARNSQRGKDANTMQLLLGLAAILTPSFSGFLITVNLDLIFIVGGALTSLSALTVYMFYKEEKEENPLLTSQ